MKSIKLYALTICLLAGSVTQAGWMKYYGNGVGYCVQVTNDNNYIISGYKVNDLILFETDTTGEVLWEQAYEGRRGMWVEQTIDEGYITCGNLKLLKTDSLGTLTWGKDVDIYTYCVQQTLDSGYIVTGLTGGGFPAYLVLHKTNSQGDSLWAQTYIREPWVTSSGLFVRQTNDKGYIVTGLLGDTLYGQEKTALWIIRTDSLGNTLWTFTQGGENWGDPDQGRCVLETSDHLYLALANFGLLKFNEIGDTLWSRNYRSGSRMQETTDSGYIIAGAVEVLSSLTTDIEPGDIWLLKTNDKGDSLWKREYLPGTGRCVAQTPDKGFIATGWQDGNLFLLRTDSLGLLGIQENPIVETDNGWNVPHSIGSYVVLHYKDLPQGFRANVFDVSGRQVDQIRGDGNEGAMTWGINQPPGVYFIQALDNRNQLKTAKVVLVR